MINDINRLTYTHEIIVACNGIMYTSSKTLLNNTIMII